MPFPPNNAEPAPEPGPAAASRRRRGDHALVVAFIAPLVLVLVAFFVWPLFESVVNSFHVNTLAGIDRTKWTLANYSKLIEPFYLGILWRTFRISIITSAITIVLAYPVAWYIAGLPARIQAYWLLVFVSPWLVNVAVKAFGWSLILSGNGVVNATLRHLGIISSPLHLMFNETGIVIGLVHAHFMFVLLPLWAAFAGLDRSLIWAAENLGAARRHVFTKIVLPLSLPALLAGGVINFTMNMAAFATPALLGGSRARVMSYIAYEVNLVNLNWPLGAAMAMLILIVTLAIVVVSQKLMASGKRKVMFT